MGNISASGNQPLVNPQTQPVKPQAAKETESKTLLEKFGDTELGQFYQDSPALSGVATGVTGLGVIGLGIKYEGLGQMIFNRGTGGVLAAGIGGVLVQDGLKDLGEGKQLSGSLKTGVGAVGVLGGAQMLTKVPVLTKPLDIAFKNGFATGGMATGVGSAFLLKSGVEDIQAGNTLTGGLKSAAGVVGGLGATELVGRQFGKSLIIEPVAKFATAKGAQATGAALGALGGAALVVDGAKRLAGSGAGAETVKGAGSKGALLNDMLGVAEVSGGALLASGAASLAGVAMGSQKLAAVLPSTAKHIGGAALAGTAYALGKETVNDVSKNGLGYLNVASGTGAGLAALGAAETFGFSKALTGGAGQYVAAAGVGVASGLLAKSALGDIKDGQYGEGALKGFGALVGGGAAMALADVPGFRNVGEAVLKHTWNDVIAPVGSFAVKNPLVAIPLAVGGAYAAYKLTKSDDSDKPVAKTAAEGGTPIVPPKAEAAAAKVEE